MSHGSRRGDILRGFETTTSARGQHAGAPDGREKQKAQVVDRDGQVEVSAFTRTLWK
jgi:hypothetical protein